MAVSHVKSNPIADAVGTVTVFNTAGVTTTMAASDLVRPRDWNSAHNQFMTIGGNTAGASTLSGTNIEFHASGAASLSANGQTLVFSAPAQSVQTQGSVQVLGSSGNISFANSNGITFGANASTVTASHNGLTSQSNQAFSAGNGSAAFQTLTFADSNGVSFSTGTQGLYATVKTDYLTTAAQSNHSHGNPTLALTNLSGTTASNSAGLTLSLSAAAPGGGGGGAALSAGTQSVSTGTVVFANSNGVTFGMSGSSQITASHNGLTTARASNDAIGLNAAQTNVTWTVNSSGLSINAAGYAGTGSGFTGGASISGSMTHDSQGLSLSLSHPAWLTTAAQSNHSHGNPTLALTNLSGTTASNSAGLTLSLSAAAPGGNGIAAAAGTQTATSGTINFANSNGVTFGMSGSSQITASYTVPTQTAQTVGVYGIGNTTGQSSSSTVDARSLSIQGAGIASVGMSNGSIIVSAVAAGAGDGGNTLAAGTQSASSNGFVRFENSNGITFGMSGSTQITASHNGLTTARASNDAIGLNTALTANGVSMTANSSGLSLNFPAFLTTARASNDAVGLNSAFTAGPLAMTVNSSGLSLNAASAAGTTSGFTGGASISGSMTHNTAGLAISLSHPAWLTTAMQSNAATISNINLSAGTTSTNASAFTFANSNGISFGLGTGASAGSITASHNGLTTARASNDAVGLNSAFTAGPLAMTVNSSGLSLNAGSAAGTTSGFTGGASISGSMTHNTAGLAISLSHPAWISTARASNDAVGLNTAQTNVTWTVNSNGLSLNAAGYAGTGTTFNGTNASASMTLNSAGLRLDLSAAAGGGGVNSGTFYATGNTTQSSSGTIALSSVIVQGAGGVSAGVSNGSLVVSGPALTSLSVTGALSASSNGSTISLGVGTVTVSATGNTTQASSGTVNLNGLILQGAGGASVGISNGSIVISGATGGAGGGAAISAGANSQSTGTVNFANSNGITFGLSNNGTMTASYNSTQFAGQGTTFAGANISASMTLNSNGLNLSASVAAPGAAAENNNINLLGANTAGNTTASGSTIGLSGLNLTLSGTNASQVVISAPATSSLVGVGGISISTNGSTISISQVPSVFSRYVNENAVTTTGLAADRSSVSIVPFMIQHQLDMSNMRCLISMSGQTTTNNSTNGAAISISGVLYSLNGSSLSSILSGSNTYTGTWSSNATASVFGARALTMNFNNTTRLAPGEYWWAVHVSSATTAANTSGTSNLTHAFTMGIGAANLTQMFGADLWGQATAATRGASVGLGILSTGATRASIAISEIQQTGSRAQAAKLWLDMRNYSVW